MENLTHWDFVENFSGFDAAALILGIEPRESEDDDDSRIRLVIDRMELHYNHALKRHYQEAFNLNSADFQDTEADRPFELESVQMNEMRRQSYPADEENPFSGWLSSEHQSQFGYQMFSRQAIADWLVANKLNSIYQFKLGQSSIDSEVTGRWPWGDHLTANLEHLEAAARKFWVNYDPSDSTTAPTNETVSNWLQTERDVSKKMADSIASMLRPDRLPTGPRK